MTNKEKNEQVTWVQQLAMERGESEYDLVRLIQIISKRETRYIDQDLTIIDTIQNSSGMAIVRNETAYGIISFLLEDLNYYGHVHYTIIGNFIFIIEPKF